MTAIAITVLLGLSLALNAAGIVKDHRHRRLLDPGRCQCRHFECHHHLVTVWSPPKGETGAHQIVSQGTRGCAVKGCTCQQFILMSEAPRARALEAGQ